MNLLPNFSNPDEIALKNQDTLRRLVGTLGMLLPVVLYLFLQITDNFNPVLPSISHYYFTRANCFFQIIVSLLAVFLLIYKGFDVKDFLASNLAGVAALLMLIFPTNNLWQQLNGKFDAVTVTCFEGSEFRPKFHYACAAIFLSSLAYLSLFRFTKTKPGAQPSKRKIIRNIIYRICGIIMLAAMLTAFLGYCGVINETYYDAHNLTFWMEVIAVEAFGISWMVKSEVILAG